MQNNGKFGECLYKQYFMLIISLQRKQNKENSQAWHCLTLLDSRCGERQPDTHVFQLT